MKKHKEHKEKGMSLCSREVHFQGATWCKEPTQDEVNDEWYLALEHIDFDYEYLNTLTEEEQEEYIYNEWTSKILILTSKPSNFAIKYYIAAYKE